MLVWNTNNIKRETYTVDSIEVVRLSYSLGPEYDDMTLHIQCRPDKETAAIAELRDKFEKCYACR